MAASGGVWVKTRGSAAGYRFVPVGQLDGRITSAMVGRSQSYFDSLSEKELGRRLDLTRQQQASAYGQLLTARAPAVRVRLERAIDNLATVEQQLVSARMQYA